MAGSWLAGSRRLMAGSWLARGGSWLAHGWLVRIELPIPKNLVFSKCARANYLDITGMDELSVQ
eukprot:7182045-Lingulodinium_polyedra.AAC.1